jgi:hypothetical protein
MLGLKAFEFLLLSSYVETFLYPGKEMQRCYIIIGHNL